MEFTTKSSWNVKRYDGYLTEYGSHVDGNLTQGENIPDNVGFHVSLLAYRKRIPEKKSKEMSLPGLEQFTIEHLYSCERVRPELEKTWHLLDAHSPMKFRVNGVVSNSEELVTIFNCTKAK